MKLFIFKYSIVLVILGSLLSGCTEGDKFNYEKNVAYIQGIETSPVVKFVVEDTPATYVIALSTSHKVDKDVDVKFALDASLVEAYNNQKGTNYYSIPESAIQLEGKEGVIKAGKSFSSALTVKMISTEDLIDGRTYVVPITVKETSGIEVLDACKTIFLQVSRVIQFTSLDISNSGMYSNYIVPDNKIVPLKNFTFEVKCYSQHWHHIARMCALRSDESCMLRFGENGMDENSLQWVSPGGNLLSKTRFELNRWYNISLTYDGNKFIMYVDGVKDAELIVSKSFDYLTFKGIELGMSWTSYPWSQYFRGRIAELRVWNRALSSSELKLGICGVDPASEGLVAYWKMNEGSGHIFYDSTKHGYDMDWSQTYREITEGGGMQPTPNAGSSVAWNSDESNKCNQ